MKSDVFTVRLDPEINEKLEKLADNTDRSKNYHASQAIASYVERNAWQVEEIKRGLEEARSGAPGIPHEKVVDWVNSWNTDNELPRPEPEQ